MTKLFHARLDGRLIEIKRNLRRKKRHTTNQDSNIVREAVLEIETSPNPV